MSEAGQSAAPFQRCSMCSPEASCGYYGECSTEAYLAERRSNAMSEAGQSALDDCVHCPHPRDRHLRIGYRLAAEGARCADCECIAYHKPVGTMTAGQSDAERAFRDWWDPLERDGVALPWIPRQVFDAGYAAGAREQAGRFTLTRDEVEWVLDCLPIDRYAWQDEKHAGALLALGAKLRAALAAKEPTS